MSAVDESSTGNAWAYGHSSGRRITPVAGRWPVRIAVISAGIPSVVGSESSRRGIETVPYDDGLAALLSLAEDRPAALVIPTDTRNVDPVALTRVVVACTEIPVVIATYGTVESVQIAAQAVDEGARALLNLPLRASDLEALIPRLGSSALRKTDAEILHVGRISLNPQAFRATLDGVALPLTAREFALLHTLLREQPRIVPAEELASAHQPDGDTHPEHVKVSIGRLRRRLERIDADAGALIQTVRGLGYRLNTSAGTECSPR
jgi:DNA-binding response OmpR family regulator